MIGFGSFVTLCGVINYIRYLYGSSKGVVNAGDEFASGYRVAA